jgi:hypothetical protein
LTVSSDSGGGSTGVITALVVVILLLLGGAGVIMYRRRKARNYGLPTSVRILKKKGDDGDETHIVNSSQSDEDIIPDVETPSPRTERKVSRKVSNVVERDDDSSCDSSSCASIADFDSPSTAPVCVKRVTRQPESGYDDEPKMVRKSSKLDLLKEKRKAIEAWNTEKKQGSQRSLSSFIPSEDLEGKKDKNRSGSKRHMHAEKKQGSQRSHSLSFLPPDEDLQDRYSKDTSPIMPRSSSNRELCSNPSSDAPRAESHIRKERTELDTMIDQLKTTRKGLLERVNLLKHHTTEGEANGISSRQMNSLMKDRAESTLRLSQLDDALKHYQRRMETLEAEAKAVRNERKAKEIARLSMSESALDSSIDDEHAEMRMKERNKERNDRRLKKSSSDPSLKDKGVKKERPSSRNLSRQDSDPKVMEKRERRKSGSCIRDLHGQGSESSSGNNRVKKEGGTSLRKLPSQDSSDSSVVERRERRKSGSSRDLSHQGSEASAKKRSPQKTNPDALTKKTTSRRKSTT